MLLSKFLVLSFLIGIRYILIGPEFKFSYSLIFRQHFNTIDAFKEHGKPGQQDKELWTRDYDKLSKKKGTPFTISLS